MVITWLSVHRCSIRFKSGKQAGKSKIWILLAELRYLVQKIFVHSHMHLKTMAECAWEYKCSRNFSFFKKSIAMLNILLQKIRPIASHYQSQNYFWQIVDVTSLYHANGIINIQDHLNSFIFHRQIWPDNEIRRRNVRTNILTDTLIAFSFNTLFIREVPDPVIHPR